MFYLCKKCGHQFVKEIQPCPDCNSADGFQLIEKKGQPVLTQITSGHTTTVAIGKVREVKEVKEVKIDKKKKKKR